MNRLFGASKPEEPQPTKKEETVVPEEPPKKTVIPLSDQQAKVSFFSFSWKTKLDNYLKLLHV